MPSMTKAATAGSVTKRKVSVSLDDDLLTYLEGHTEPLSVQVNAAVRAEVERRRHQAALARFCDEYVQDNGPWTDEDEAEIQRIMQLLGG